MAVHRGLEKKDVSTLRGMREGDKDEVGVGSKRTVGGARRR